MALADILTTGEDVTETKQALTRTLLTLSGAAQDYAKASLGAATAVLEVAMDGGPCAATYTNFTETRRFGMLARNALSSASDVANMLMASNDSPDDAANDAYSQHLIGMTNTDLVSAILEGANSRMQMAYKSMPANPQPAARFDASIYASQEGA